MTLTTQRQPGRAGAATTLTDILAANHIPNTHSTSLRNKEYKRRPASLLTVASALCNIHSITGMRIFRAMDYAGDELTRVAFPPNGSRQILNLYNNNNDVIRFRLLLERAGIGEVGTRVLLEALAVAELPIVPWSELMHLLQTKWTPNDLDQLLKGSRHAEA